MLLFICNQVSLNDTSGKIEEIITISIHIRLRTKGRRREEEEEEKVETIFISLSPFSG